MKGGQSRASSAVVGCDWKLPRLVGSLLQDAVACRQVCNVNKMECQYGENFGFVQNVSAFRLIVEATYSPNVLRRPMTFLPQAARGIW